MTIDLDAPRTEPACDLCRREAELYRLVATVDALCESCFGMLHC